MYYKLEFSTFITFSLKSNETFGMWAALVPRLWFRWIATLRREVTWYYPVSCTTNRAWVHRTERGENWTKDMPFTWISLLHVHECKLNYCTVLAPVGGRQLLSQGRICKCLVYAENYC